MTVDSSRAGDTWQTASRKRLVVAAASFGAAFAVVVFLLIDVVTWYGSRPKPWNTTALNATFDGLGTEGSRQTLVFYYSVENTTPSDYRVEDKSGIFITGRLTGKKALAPDYEHATLTYPVFIPAEQRIRIAVHVPEPFNDECTEELRNPAPEPHPESQHVASAAGTLTIESFASRVREKDRACDLQGDRELVAEVIRLYPVYLTWLKPGESNRIFANKSRSGKELTAFVEIEMPDLDGFVLFDSVHRYEIDCPKGW